MQKAPQALKVEYRATSDLIYYERNARTHSESQIAQIAASIKTFGWTNPILIGKDNVIIAGHARLLAARKLGMSEVPVIVLDHLTSAQRRALVLADNKLALNAGWNEEMLRLELGELQSLDFDLDLLGFDHARRVLSGCIKRATNANYHFRVHVLPIIVESQQI